MPNKYKKSTKRRRTGVAITLGIAGLLFGVEQLETKHGRTSGAAFETGPSNSSKPIESPEASTITILTAMDTTTSIQFTPDRIHPSEDVIPTVTNELGSTTLPSTLPHVSPSTDTEAPTPTTTIPIVHIDDTAAIKDALESKPQDLEIISTIGAYATDRCVGRYLIEFTDTNVEISMLVAGSPSSLDDPNDLAGGGYVHDSDPAGESNYESTILVPDTEEGLTAAVEQVRVNTDIACRVFDEVFGTYQP